MEYAPWDNVSLKAEYLYVNLGGGHTVTGFALTDLPSTFTADYSKTDFHVVRGGLNFHFGAFGKGPVGKGPVVTRY